MIKNESKLKELTEKISFAEEDMKAYQKDCLEKASIIDSQIDAENVEKKEQIRKVFLLSYIRPPAVSNASQFA